MEEEDYDLIVCPKTGEVKGYRSSKDHYHTPKKLNCKGSFMGLRESMIALVNGKSDLIALFEVWNHADASNVFTNPGSIARDIGWDTSRFSKFIARGSETGMWRRIGRGKYFINPTLYVSPKAVALGNKHIIHLQNEWNQ